MLPHFGAPSPYIERETRKISYEGLKQNLSKKGWGCGEKPQLLFLDKLPS
jgi:hypothetical protein